MSALENVQRLTDMENEASDLMRMIANKDEEFRGLKEQGDNQLKELTSIQGNAEYTEQTEELSNEIKKWKSKYKLMQQYSREEEQNFRGKFDLLNQVNENRFRMKEMIIEAKHMPPVASMRSYRSEVPNKKSLARVSS